jgi:hypothetical protein
MVQLILFLEYLRHKRKMTVIIKRVRDQKIERGQRRDHTVEIVIVIDHREEIERRVEVDLTEAVRKNIDFYN